MLNRLNQTPKNHRDALIALTHIHQLGIQRIRLLLQVVEHPAEIFTLTTAELEQIDGIGPGIAASILDFDDWHEVQKVIAKADKAGTQIISYADNVYPPLLREIYDPPVLLWVKGNAEVLKNPGIAVVGTRRATQYGKEITKEFAKELAGRGLTITSGLAFGIDAVAHATALEAAGTTIAVLGSGIDTIYPQKNAALARDIIKNGGAVITEFPMSTPPDAGNFPVRNRIVSGLSLGTLVVESGLKGGSMITAQSALMQNREVFVIPHSLENVNGIGCNNLIKRGAGKLVQSVEDILEELPYYEAETEQPVKQAGNKSFRWQTLELDDEAAEICRILETEAMHIDALSESLGIPSHELLPKLLELEMQQCIRQKAGKNFELV